MATVTVTTLGCKVNQFESEALMASLEDRGHRLVPFGEPAEITIVNTCTVTHRADFQSRQMVRRAHRFNPGALLIVTGCYAQVDPEAFRKIKGVHYLLGNAEKASIPDLLPRMLKGEIPRTQVADIQKETSFTDTPLFSFHHHTRAFLKIQDGCSSHCSYCIVPQARGSSRSLSPEKVVRYAEVLKARKFKEVVLTGVHIGTYGLDLSPPYSLSKLLEQFEQAETPPRIRLSSIEPADFSSDLISSLSKSFKICPHLHIPIQSGDDEILRRMNRPYTCSFIADLFQDLQETIPNLCLGADIIVGFPGETEEQFRKTYQLLETLPLSYLHVFPFSRRKGTPASQLPQQVETVVIRRRSEALRELGREKRRAFYRRFLHQELMVLVEDRKDNEPARWRGLSRNYIPVVVIDETKSARNHDRVNEEVKVVITEATERGVIGNLMRSLHG
jgi:threonylcarbamoyladenosine tRNA methylthiotransferase MtaB